MPSERPVTTTAEIDPGAVEPVLREGDIGPWIVGLRILGTLPLGAGRKLPGGEGTVAGAVIGVETVGVVVSLLYGLPGSRGLVAAGLEGPSDVAAAAASIVGYGVAFLAVLLAHQWFVRAPNRRGLGFRRRGPTLCPGPTWGIASQFAGALDPLATFLTAELLRDRLSRASDAGVGEDTQS